MFQNGRAGRVLVIAATRVDQEFFAADLQQPAVHAELDEVLRRIVVAGCKP